MQRSPEQRQPQSENGGPLSTQASQIESQILMLQSMYAGSKEKPEDYLQDVLLGDDFKTLSPDEQSALRSKYGLKAEQAAKPETPPQPVQEAAPAVEAAEPQTADLAHERRENKEPGRGEKPTWRFNKYVLRPNPEETGGFLIFEDRSKYNGRHYSRGSEIETAIRLPQELSERLAQEPDLGPRIVRFCEDLRRQLDRGLPIFFDRDKKRGGRRPKWSATYNSPSAEGERITTDQLIKVAKNDSEPGETEEIDPYVLPAYLNDLAQEYWRLYEPLYEEERRNNPEMKARDLNALVRNRIPKNNWYFSKEHNPRWTDWEGLARQRVREDVITAELGRYDFQKAAVEPPPDEPNRPEAEAAAVPVPEKLEEGTAEPAETGPAIEEPAVKAVEPAESQAPAAEKPAPSAPEKAAETIETDRRDQELLDLSRPMFRELLPAVIKIDGRRNKEGLLDIVKQVVKTTGEILARRYARAEDVENQARILHPEFKEKLSIEVAKELRRQVLSRQFFEEHSFFDTNSVEVTSDKQIVFDLKKLRAKGQNEALEEVSRQMVFDAIYGGPEPELADDLAGDEARLVELIAVTLSRIMSQIKGQETDIIKYDAVGGRVTVNDLEALRQIIRSRAKPPKR